MDAKIDGLPRFRRRRPADHRAVAAQRPHLPVSQGQVWAYDTHEGFRRSVDSAAAVAAPLLAGFSLTLLGLIVQSFADERTTVKAPTGVEVVTDKSEFSAAPEIAAGLVLLAALLLIFSVQAAIGLRRHNHTPAELKDLWPEHFPTSKEGNQDEPDVQEGLRGWNWVDAYANAVPVRVGHQWYSGFARAYLYSEWIEADKWAYRMRWLYHAGILALLAGMAALVWPPGGDASVGRCLLVVLAAAGCAAEGMWIWWGSDVRRKRRQRRLKSASPTP